MLRIIADQRWQRAHRMMTGRAQTVSLHRGADRERIELTR